jgi:hypothetical protein
MAALLAFGPGPNVPGPDAERPAPRQCMATLDPDTVPIQTDSTIVSFTVPDSIGAITAVTPAEDSGIVTGGIDAAAHTVAVGTATATAGDWTLTFAGDSSRTCAGTLTVVGIQHR